MSNSKGPKSDLIPAVSQANLPHILYHPVLGVFLGDGLWSNDQRKEMKDKIVLVEAAPTFPGNFDLSKFDLGPSGWNAIQRATMFKQIEMIVCFPDMPNEGASRTQVQNMGVPSWGKKC